MKIKKTNAIRILDDHKIPYSIKEYSFDEEHLDAIHVASEVRMPVEQIFKTICIRGDKSGIFFACIPGSKKINLKAIAKLSENKKAELVHVKELFELTGYIRGGCSPLGAKKKYPVFLDESAKDWNEIAISAGKRGIQILLNSKDLINISNGMYGKITFSEKK